jgi:hypothetical protein
VGLILVMEAYQFALNHCNFPPAREIIQTLAIMMMRRFVLMLCALETCVLFPMAAIHENTVEDGRSVVLMNRSNGNIWKVEFLLQSQQKHCYLMDKVQGGVFRIISCL